MAQYLAGFSIQDIIEDAVELATGQTATASDVTRAKRALILMLTEWENRGYKTYAISTIRIGISATPTFLLPDNVADILIANVERTGGEIQTPMVPIAADAYARISTKTTKGRPSQYWFQQTQPPKITLYPICDGGTLVIQYIKTPENLKRWQSEFSVPDDLPRRWLAALIHGLAFEIARRRADTPGDKLAALKVSYEEQILFANQADKTKAPFRMIIGR